MIANVCAKLRAALAAGSGTALISHPANRHYFSGFPAGDHAPDESSGLLVVSADDARLFVSPTNLPFGRKTRPGPGRRRPLGAAVAERSRQSHSRGRRTRGPFEDERCPSRTTTASWTPRQRCPSLRLDQHFTPRARSKTRTSWRPSQEAARITDAAFLPPGRSDAGSPRKRWPGDRFADARIRRGRPGFPVMCRGWAERRAPAP